MLPRQEDSDTRSSTSSLTFTHSHASKSTADQHIIDASSIPQPERPIPKKSAHIDRNDLIRDAIIGFADGLTVPFALTAGLSAIGSTRLVIVGGLAELFAGAISMGLGAWLAATTERKAFQSEEVKQYALLNEKPELEIEEICTLFGEYGVGPEIALPLAEQLRLNGDMFIKFKLDFLLRMSKPTRLAAIFSALSMGLAYFLGGLIPMIPYFAFRDNVDHALFTSIGITILILLTFGYVKSIITGSSRLDAVSSALQTLIVGAVAAGASYGIVRGVNASLGG